MAKITTVLARDLRATGTMLNAEYWVNKAEGKAPYYVQEGILIPMVRADLTVHALARAIYLTPEAAKEYQKALNVKRAAEQTMEKLKGA